MLNARVLIAGLLGSLACLAAQADETATLKGTDLSFQPEPSVVEDAALRAASQPSVSRDYGLEGTSWLTFSTGVATDFSETADVPLKAAYSVFVEDGIELGFEVGAWYFSQEDDDALGLSGSFLFRWHFLRRDPWTVYLDAGMGIMGATDEVPDGGTAFNFMPRAGAGFTRRLNDEGLRLQAGVHWHHISNARIFGDDENPSRDAAMVYVGLIFPF